MQTFEQVQALVNAFVALFPDCEKGAGHVVFNDGNYADEFIDSLLSHLHLSDVQSCAMIALLNLLLTIPESVRVPPAFGTDCTQCGANIDFDETPIPCPSCGHILQ